MDHQKNVCSANVTKKDSARLKQVLEVKSTFTMTIEVNKVMISKRLASTTSKRKNSFQELSHRKRMKKSLNTSAK